MLLPFNIETKRVSYYYLLFIKHTNWKLEQFETAVCTLFVIYHLRIIMAMSHEAIYYYYSGILFAWRKILTGHV